jgi:hypothetical protein
MVLALGISELAAWAGTDNDVTPSSSRLFQQSQEAEIREKVHIDNGMCDVGHDEPPREISA